MITWRYGVGAALLLASAGCSLLLNLKVEQCSTTADCEAAGQAFRGFVCESGSCVRPVSLPDDTDGGPNAADSGSEAGGGPCTTNLKCTEQALDQPSICRNAAGGCVNLKKNNLCPLVVDDVESPGPYTNDAAIVVGGILNFVPGDVYTSSSVASVALAFRELQARFKGLPPGTSGGPRRPVVGVFCRRDPETLAEVEQHLFETVGVQAVIAHLSSDSLISLYNKYGNTRELFVMNPGYSNSALNFYSQQAQGRYWHAIGDARDTAPPYQPLLLDVERRLRAERDGSTANLKVAVVASDTPTDIELNNAVLSVLQWNGKSYLANGANYVPASYVVGDDASYAALRTKLIAERPDVIVVNGRYEFFLEVAPDLEANWPGGQPRPSYIVQSELAPENDAADSIRKFLVDERVPPGTERRVLGVAIESPADIRLESEYVGRMTSIPTQRTYRGGFENFYDAAYTMLYALYAAPSTGSPTGKEVASGMAKLFSGTAKVEVGPEAIVSNFTTILSEVKSDASAPGVRFVGTMGEWDVNPSTYSRRSRGSVFCLRDVGGTGVDKFLYQPDVFRYVDASKSLTSAGANACYPGFPQ